MKVGYKLSTFVVPEIFYQTIQFDDVLLKNYLVLYAKRKESGPKIRSLVGKIHIYLILKIKNAIWDVKRDDKFWKSKITWKINMKR